MSIFSFLKILLKNKEALQICNVFMGDFVTVHKKNTSTRLSTRLNTSTLLSTRLNTSTRF